MSNVGTIWIDGINLKQRIAVARDGEIGDIVELIDGWGDITDDEKEAVSCVVTWRSGMAFTAIDISEFEAKFN